MEGTSIVRTDLGHGHVVALILVATEAAISSAATVQADAEKPTLISNVLISAVTGKTTVKMIVPLVEIHLIVEMLAREVKNNAKRAVEASLRRKKSIRR